MPRTIPTPPKPAEEMTDAEKAAYRAQLEAALDAISPVAPAGSRPGMVVGEGYNREYVPYTREWFLDIEARRKDVDAAGNLVWPDYQKHPIVGYSGPPSVVKIHGVPFGLLPGRVCYLPTPHYRLYMDGLEQQRAEMAQYDPPEGKPKEFTVYRMPGVWDKAPTE